MSCVTSFATTCGGATPLPIKCRHEYVRSVVKLPNGTSVTLDSQAVVSQRIQELSLFWLGTLADWNATGGTDPDNELMIVMTYNAKPDDKARYYYRTVGLMRKAASLLG